jgi:thiamine biosynthesis lipoprotein ApbE
VRGNLVGNRVQIELLDTAGDLESTFTGTVDPTAQRMVGTWQATELASGQPAQGAWLASRTSPGTERQP